MHRLTIANPTTKMKPLAKNQPQTSPTGPAGIEYASVDAIDGRRPMILKAIPNTSIIVKLRRNSCLYPSLAMMDCQSPQSQLFRNLTRLRQQYHLRWQVLAQYLFLLSENARPTTFCSFRADTTRLADYIPILKIEHKTFVRNI